MSEWVIDCVSERTNERDSNLKEKRYFWRVWWVNQTEVDRLEDLGIDGQLISKWNLENRGERMWNNGGRLWMLWLNSVS